MRFVRRLGVGLVLIAAAFAVAVWMQPDDYRLTRQAVIAAPASAIFPHVNDLRQWEDWSPWAKRDPTAKISFEGPPAGPGAMFHWSGNDKVGAGTMTITESRPNARIATRTDFMKPFEGTSKSDFVFSESGGQTTVVWTMAGTHSFIGKAMCMITSMEQMLGPDVERGLMQLKQVSEAR